MNQTNGYLEFTDPITFIIFSVNKRDPFYNVYFILVSSDDELVLQFVKGLCHFEDLTERCRGI